MVALVWPTESRTSARKSMTPTSICVFSPQWWSRKKTQSSSMTRGIGPWSLRYAPSNVSPVWQLTRRRRRSAIGGRATARAIDGHAAANPVIKDRNSRRSMALFGSRAITCKRYRRHHRKFRKRQGLQDARAEPDMTRRKVSGLKAQTCLRSSSKSLQQSIDVVELDFRTKALARTTAQFVQNLAGFLQSILIGDFDVPLIVGSVIRQRPP